MVFLLLKIKLKFEGKTIPFQISSPHFQTKQGKISGEQSSFAYIFFSSLCFKSKLRKTDKMVIFGMVISGVAFQELLFCFKTVEDP